MATLQQRGNRAADLRTEVAGLQTDLAAAHSQIETLAAKETSAEERLAITIAEKASLDLLLANHVAEVTEAERRIAGYGATLDERNTQLIEAQRALEKSVVEHNRELGLYARRIAAMKSSLSWRLTSPFREMYRPFRGLRTSPWGVKLSAALRHPANSRKRKKYRLAHMPELAVVESANLGRRTHLAHKLRAIARHPFSRRLRREYRKGLHGFQPGSQASALNLSALPPHILKVIRPKSIKDGPNWLIYSFLKTLAHQSWLFPERRAHKFRKSANKRAAMLNRRNVQLVLQEVAHNDLISLEEAAIPPSAAPTAPVPAQLAQNEIDRHPFLFTHGYLNIL